jgi:hypothetical protein
MLLNPAMVGKDRERRLSRDIGGRGLSSSGSFQRLMRSTLGYVCLTPKQKGLSGIEGG